MLSCCKNQALACRMDFTRTRRSALHSSGVHLCLFLPVAEFDLPSWGQIEPLGTGTAPERPVVVGMAEQLSPADGKRRMLCTQSPCLVL